MKSKVVTVNSTSSVLIMSTTSATRKVYIGAGANDIKLGGADVSAVNGFPLKINERIEIEIPARNALYGIAVTGSHDIYVMEPEGDF